MQKSDAFQKGTLVIDNEILNTAKHAMSQANRIPGVEAEAIKRLARSRFGSIDAFHEIRDQISE